MNEEMIPVLPNDKLAFKCSSENSCFNECCRDLNQFLTPYDILRLKNNLKIKSSDFLRKFTSMHKGPETGLPLISFKPDPDSGHACPFVTKQGCSVYGDRPASCRMYPLARAITRSRDTGEIDEYFAVIEEEHCKGFGQEKDLTVNQWIDTQDVKIYNEMNDKLMEIISLKNMTKPGNLVGVEEDNFYLACYDLDSFRDKIFNDGLLSDLSIPDSVLDKVKEDDVALLDLGLEWVKHFLFGKKMKFDQ
ncbi:MAG: YkgJ family cysteine cluster protein [Desulfobacteraceae bacterium]|nr:YkgJ family cysteine cluster protein [Desulfobacteraceae bacterium]